MSKDPTAEQRKKDHIQLAFQSIVEGQDPRFYYEPILSGFPKDDKAERLDFCGKQLQHPLWISSMTGGTEYAGKINKTLAQACHAFGLGMGLGSCRQLLESDSMLKDFAVRDHMPNSPLIANLGIAQMQELEDQKALDKVNSLVDKLDADGLFIHINPLQEWTQPEGDRYYRPPIETIQHCLDVFDFPILVKEVGQGMGPASLRALLHMPLEAIELGAHGGTNFSLLELLRGNEVRKNSLKPVVSLGHSAKEMTHLINAITQEKPDNIKTKRVIISGGVKHFLDGYYFMELCRMPAMYAQASPMLKHALEGYDALEEYIRLQLEGLKMSNAFLTLKEKV